jgi:hypothetical protein
MRKHKRVLFVLAALMCFLFILWHFCFQPMNQIPEPDEVVAMQAKLYNSSGELVDLPLFEVPREHVAPILEALRPFRVEWPFDWTPWQVLGELHLTCKGEKSFRIDLYRTSHERGAFSAGPTYETRRYYRGGTDSAIEDAIRAAYPAKSQ